MDPRVKPEDDGGYGIRHTFSFVILGLDPRIHPHGTPHATRSAANAVVGLTPGLY